MSYGELLLFVHEAQSGSMEEEILKGCTWIMPHAPLFQD